MATIATEEKRCAVCGKTSVQGFVADAGREGSADLDLRPPPDQRETIAHWVQECPHCGYCGLSLEEPTAGAAEVIASEGYRALREGTEPELVVRLLCASTLLEHADRWVEAAQAAQRAGMRCGRGTVPSTCSTRSGAGASTTSRTRVPRRS